MSPRQVSVLDPTPLSTHILSVFLSPKAHVRRGGTENVHQGHYIYKPYTRVITRGTRLQKKTWYEAPFPNIQQVKKKGESQS
jgi:hypothetical protein